MAARPDVFVSYSRHDKAFVEGTLFPALVAAGKDVWIDLEDIPPADDWHEQVLAGVAAANAVVFVLSPDSVGSEICGQELGRAVELNKRLIPVVRRDPGQVPPALSRPNWIFLRDDEEVATGMPAVLEALDSDLEWRDAHSRLAVRTNEWLGHGRDRSYLLRGSDLRAAETWLTQQAEHEERPTADQTRYIVASRQASSRRARFTLLAVLGALGVASVLAVLALVQRHQAIEREHVARSRELAASALSALPRDPELSVLLARAGVSEDRTAEAEDALRRALAESYVSATLRGHEGPVNAGAFAGRGVVTVGSDRTVRVWDGARETARMEADAPLWGVAAAGGKVVATGEDGTATLWASGTPTPLPGASGTVFAPVFSADGRLVVAPSTDGRARVWDASDGHLVATLPHRAVVWSAQFDRAGRRVVTASADGSAVVWRDGRAVAVMQGHKGDVNQARFSPDGALVATAGKDGTARLWNAGTGAAVRVLRGHTALVRSLAFSADSRRLVTASDDKTAAVWDVRAGRRLFVLGGHDDAVLGAAYSPDGALIATTSADNTARMWDAATGRLVATFRGHTDELGRPQFSPDGKRFLTASADGTARIWRVPQVAAPLDGGGPLMGAALSGSHVLTWNKDTEARLFDGGRLVAKRTLVADGAFLPDGRAVVVSGSTETAAEVLDPDTGRVVVAMRGPIGADVGVGGDRIATVGLAKGDVRVWDSRSGREVARFGEGARAVSLSPDGRRAIVMTLFGGVSSWDATTGRRLGSLDANAGVLSPAAAFAPDGRRAALTSAEGPVPIWDLRSARPEQMLVSHAQFPSEVIGVAWGGDRIAVADRSASGAARIFDAAGGRVVAELREHTGEIRSIAFSPDDRWLVTASRDGTAWVWEAATGRPVQQLLGHRGPLVTAAFAADGRHVLTASKDGTARIHDCTVCAPLDALMRMRPARALTADERRVYLHAD